MMLRGAIILAITLAIGSALSTFKDPIGMGQLLNAALVWGGFVVLVGALRWIKERDRSRERVDQRP
jgi:hypothetical protein|tara:strand:+ start:508 stop:705 length:198 start_codon:yes stop_codon:yes gene_type:complete